MLRFDHVLSYFRNKDTTYFKRKSWVDSENFKGHHIFLDLKTGKIMLRYNAWGYWFDTIIQYKPNSEDMFAFDWIVMGGD